MTNLKKFIEAHTYGIWTVISGILYAATLVASVWFIRDYCQLSKAVKEIYRIQQEVHPFNLKN